MQVNRESNLMVNTPPVSVSNNGLVVPPSPLEKNEKNENLETSEKSTKRVSHQSVEQDLSDEKRVQNELHTGSVDFEDSEKIALMSDLRDLKAPSALSESDDSDLIMNEPVKLKQENKTDLVESQTSETQMENPTLLDLDNLLPPELPLLTDLRTETQSKNIEGLEKTSQQVTLKEVETESKLEAKTETKFPSWTKNNLSSLVQAQFKKQLTSWDASGIINTRAKQSKALISQAQKLSAEILSTPGYKEMFFEKSETELRDALADAVGQLKKNDPKFKNLKDSSYQSLPKDKQAFVDAILTGLKAGLPKEVQNSVKFLNKVGKPEGVTGQQLVNKAELMGEIEKRRDQKMSPEGLNALEELDKARQAKDLKSAKTRIKAETEILELDNIFVQTKLTHVVPGTELSATDLQQLMKTAFGESQDTYSDEEVQQAQAKAEGLIQKTTDPKLIWTVTLRPEKELFEDLNLALHGKIKDLTLDQEDYTQKILYALRKEGLNKLESQGFVSKRDSNTKTPKEIQLNGKTYTHMKQLGQGGFGVAHLFETTHPLTQEKEQVVVKQFKRGNLDPDTWFGNMQQEIRAHQYAMGPEGQGHENVLALKGILFDSQSQGLGEFFTVTEVASKGELKDVSDKIDLALKNKALTPTTHELLKRSLLAQTMRGMKYVQSQRGMLHKDLKPENIFVTAQGQLKIADFGISHTKNTVDGSSAWGTPVYMSPENAGKFISEDNKNKDTKITTGADVWSLGVMSRQLLTGNFLSAELQKQQDKGVALGANNLFNDTTLFGENINNRVYQKGSKETRLGHEKKVETKKSGGLSALFKSSAKKTSSETKSYEVKSLGAYEKVINAMMHPDQNQRPTFEALSQHSLFTDQILQEPKLQALFQAILDNKDTQTIQKLSQEVEVLNKRLK
jgi:serine/threonine protein kinase